MFCNFFLKLLYLKKVPNYSHSNIIIYKKVFYIPICLKDVYRTIRWKLKEHSDLVKFAFKWGILFEVISREFRKNSCNTWLEIPCKLAFSKGFVFSEATPSTALREIFLEEIYNINGFTPAEDQVLIDAGANYGDSAIWWAQDF